LGRWVVRAIAPRTGAPENTIAEDQPEYIPVTLAFYEFRDAPAAKGVLWRLTMTKEERERILQGEDIYIMQVYPNKEALITPMSFSVGPMPCWIVPESDG
jgi:hypothetical protein